LLIGIADAGQYHIFESVSGKKHLKEGKTKVYTTIEFTILRLKPSERKELIPRASDPSIQVYFQNQSSPKLMV